MPVIYPTGGQYREALFDTRRCFKDPALVGGKPDLDGLGMPRPLSGGSASVFTIRSTSGRRIAIKCFIRYVPDQMLRYERISQSLSQRRAPWQVEFEYLSDGVMCNGKWFPVLKMEWVEGTSLIGYIESNLRNPIRLRALAEQFAELVRDLSVRGVAHGDLQHGNLLVTPSGDLKLIDYDGMFVPGLEDVGASELGHPNYQSPHRTFADWGPFLDYFSSWIIYSSLAALAIDPTLWALLHRDGDEALLFRKDDFLAPERSRALRALTGGPGGHLQELRDAMAALWGRNIAAIPPLAGLATAWVKAAASASLIGSSSGRTEAGGGVPGWLMGIAYEQLGAAVRRKREAPWISEHLPHAEPSSYEPRSALLRILAGVWLIVAAGVSTWAVLSSPPMHVEDPAIAFIALAFPAASSVLYRTTARWQEKRRARRKLRACRSDARKAHKEVERLRKMLKVIDREERKLLDSIAKRAAAARRTEERAIAALDKKHDVLIAKITKQRQSLQARETAEMKRALSALQQQHVDGVLRAATVSSARIPGIGPGVASSLAAHGIRSAADFAGIVYGPGQGGGRQIYIRLRNGGRVHPQGVGEKKATSLESWRRSVEARASASKPSSLPAEQASSIRTRFAAEQQDLVAQEGVARSSAASEVQAVRQKWAPIQIGISEEKIAAQGDSAQRRTRAEDNIRRAQEHVTELVWMRVQAERELESYGNVSYRKYLARVVRS